MKNNMLLKTMIPATIGAILLGAGAVWYAKSKKTVYFDSEINN